MASFVVSATYSILLKRGLVVFMRLPFDFHSQFNSNDIRIITIFFPHEILRYGDTWLPGNFCPPKVCSTMQGDVSIPSALATTEKGRRARCSGQSSGEGLPRAAFDPVMHVPGRCGGTRLEDCRWGHRASRCSIVPRYLPRDAHLAADLCSERKAQRFSFFWESHHSLITTLRSCSSSELARPT